MTDLQRDRSQPLGAAAELLRLIDTFLVTQREYVRSYSIFAVALAVLGLAVFFVALTGALGAQQEVLKGIVGVGGTFVTTLSTFPLKEVLSRRDKTRLLLLIRDEVPSAGKARLAQLRRELWRIVGKRLED